MTPRDRRPDNEQGPVNWGIMPKRTPRPKNSSTRPGGSGRLESVRSANNPASSASTASAATGASAASASGSADGVSGARGAGGAAVMTEEDMRSAAAQAIASGTADAVDAAIAIDLADVAGDDSGWADSAVSAGSPASPVTLRAVGSPVEDSEAHGEPGPTSASVPPTGNSAASAPGSAAAAAQQDRAVAGVVNDSRSSRPVVRPTAVDGTGSDAPRSGAPPPASSPSPRADPLPYPVATPGPARRHSPLPPPPRLPTLEVRPQAAPGTRHDPVPRPVAPPRRLPRPVPRPPAYQRARPRARQASSGPRRTSASWPSPVPGRQPPMPSTPRRSRLRAAVPTGAWVEARPRGAASGVPPPAPTGGWGADPLRAPAPVRVPRGPRLCAGSAWSEWSSPCWAWSWPLSRP